MVIKFSRFTFKNIYRRNLDSDCVNVISKKYLERNNNAKIKLRHERLLPSLSGVTCKFFGKRVVILHRQID